jgi:S-adenosylmethionine-diacylglycerol 3-amino-3-carboxypropyl transferase
MSKSEIQHRADFSKVRYAQCWEDSLLLIKSLHPANRNCLSIGSAGDNSFSLLAAGAAAVTAVEMNPAQVACIELRKAAYLTLDHPAFLELHGSRPSTRRAALYAECRALLPAEARAFWDARPEFISSGIGGCGKFENYFRLFRSRVLPLAHPRKRLLALLDPRSPAERRKFYDEIWNNRRWRAIFQVFFSRTLMGALGRDPQFFKYVEGSVAERILARTEHALAVLDPAANPYLHWILTGTHGEQLPHALEAENFDPIRQALQEDRFRIHGASIEALLESEPDTRYDVFNLSDIFEYMSEANTETLLRRLVAASNPRARLAYWNMLAPRSRPDSMTKLLEPRASESSVLFHEDRAFFYSRFVVEEVRG